MKVKELIEILSTVDGEAEITIGEKYSYRGIIVGDSIGTVDYKTWRKSMDGSNLTTIHLAYANEFKYTM